jgi:hypothetical protein
VPHAQHGSALSSSNATAAGRALEARTNYLKEILDNIESQRLLIHDHQAVDPDVVETQAVYWNRTEQRYEAALAGAEVLDGVLSATAASDPIGVVLHKYSSTDALIGIHGVTKLTTAQLANLIDGEAIPGRYYLSGTTAGKLTRQRPPVTVAVIYLLGPANDCETDSWIIIDPHPRDFLESHVHHHFELTARPAGTHVPPSIGEDHVITDGDSDLRGWLPADHDVFGGTAPVGAHFGYNISAHEALSRVWPPIPAEAAVLEIYHDSDASVPLAGRVLPDYVTIDANGIWWMTDCYDQVPWPTTLDTTVSSSSSSESSSSGTCLTASMRIMLSFARMTFATDKTVVTSLEPDTDEPIEFVDCNNEVAKVGALKARLNVNAMLADDEKYGAQVLKTIENSNLKFGRGYVVEGLTAGSARVTLSGSRTRLSDLDDEDSATLHQGIVEIDVDVDPSEREISPETVKLNDTLDREYRGALYIGFPEDRDSSILARFTVPYGTESTTLTIRGLLFGLDDGPFSEMTMSYTKIVKPTESTPTPISETSTTIDFDVVTPSTGVDANEAILVDSEEITVAAGDTIFVTLSRAEDASPTFDAEIGLIRLTAILGS